MLDSHCTLANEELVVASENQQTFLKDLQGLTQCRTPYSIVFCSQSVSYALISSFQFLNLSKLCIPKNNNAHSPQSLLQGRKYFTIAKCSTVLSNAKDYAGVISI